MIKSITGSPPKTFKCCSPGQIPFQETIVLLTEHQYPTLIDLIYSEGVNTQVWPHEEDQKG